MADPLDVKLILKASIIANPVRTTVQQLFYDFKNNEGFEVPFRKFGFSSFYDYLVSLRDVCLVIGSGPQAEVRAIVDEKSAHVADMISKQRKPAKKAKRNFGFNGRPRQNYNNFTQPRYASTPIFNTFKKPYFSQPQRYGQRPPRMITKTNFVIQQVSNGAIAPSSSYRNPNSTRPDGTKHISNVRPEMREMCREDESDYSDEFDDCEELVESNNLPCTSNKIENNFLSESNALPDTSNKIGIGLPSTSNQSNYYNTDNESSVQVNNDVSDITSKMEEVFISDNEDELNVNYKVPFSIQQNLKTLITDHPKGIWCRNMPGLYRTKFGTELNYGDFGYKSLIQMCTELGYIFNHKQAAKGDFKLYDKRLPVPEEEFEMLQGFKKFEEKIMNFEPKPNLPALPDDVADMLSNVSLQYPSQVLTICDNIPVQQVKFTGEEQRFIELKIAEVFDPSKFWFHLIQFEKPLDDLMDEMQVFYDKNWKQYLIPTYMLEENLYCAIKYLNEYHRALICNMLPKTKGKVKAFFIDYGTVSAVKIEGICYLHTSFKDLPAQGIRGRLARIHPPLKDNTWSRESASRFLDLIIEKKLIAEIDFVEEETNCFSLIVADTSGDDDVFITDTLVFEGYALFEFQEQEIDLFMKSIPIVEYIYLFPTFEELEKGSVPSATEMITILQSGIHYHAIYPQYFKMYSENEVNKSNDVDIITQADEIQNSYKEDDYVNEDIEHADEEVEPTYDEIEQTNIDTEKHESLSSSNSDMSISDLSQTSPLEPNCSNPNTKAEEIMNVEKSLHTEIQPPRLRPPPGFEHVQPNSNLIQQQCLWNYEVNAAMYKYKMQQLYLSNRFNDPRSSTPHLQNMQAYNHFYGNANNQNFARFYQQNVNGQNFVTAQNPRQNYYQNTNQPSNPVNYRPQYNYAPPYTNQFTYQNKQAQTNRPPVIPLQCNQTTNQLLNLNITNATRETKVECIQSSNLKTHNDIVKPKEEPVIPNNKIFIPTNNLQTHDKVVHPNEAQINKVFTPMNNLQTCDDVVKANVMQKNKIHIPASNLQTRDEELIHNAIPVIRKKKLFSPMSDAQTYDEVVKPNEAQVVQKNKIFIRMSNQQPPNDIAKPIEAPVTQTNIKPKTVVKTELFNKHLHIFLYKSKPHILVDEVQKQFFPSITVTKLKKGMITCEILLDHLVIKNNDVYEELRSNGAVDPTATIINIFLLSDLEDLIKYFADDKMPLEELLEFINKYKKDSVVWH